METRAGLVVPHDPGAKLRVRLDAPAMLPHPLYKQNNILGHILGDQPPPCCHFEDDQTERGHVLGVGEEGVHLPGDAGPGGFDGFGVLGVAQGSEDGVPGRAANLVAGSAGGLEPIEQAHQLVHPRDNPVLLGERWDRNLGRY